MLIWQTHYRDSQTFLHPNGVNSAGVLRAKSSWYAHKDWYGVIVEIWNNRVKFGSPGQTKQPYLPSVAPNMAELEPSALTHCPNARPRPALQPHRYLFLPYMVVGWCVFVRVSGGSGPGYTPFHILGGSIWWRGERWREEGCVCVCAFVCVCVWAHKPWVSQLLPILLLTTPWPETTNTLSLLLTWTRRTVCWLVNSHHKVVRGWVLH